MRNVKWLKKAAAMLLAGTLMCGTAAWTGAGFAAEVKAEATTVPTIDPTKTGSLTINKTDNQSPANPLQGAEFTLYQVMKFEKDDTTGEYGYKPQAPFTDVLGNVKADELLGSYSAQEIEALVKQLEAASESAQAVDVQTTGEYGTAKFSDLELGYYLVVETQVPEGYMAGQPFLVAIPSTNNYADPTAAGTKWVYDVVAKPKNYSTSIEKEIDKETGDNGVSDDGTVKVGDIVPYKITTRIPDYTDGAYTDIVFKITDVMSDGLKLVADNDKYPVTVSVEGDDDLTADRDYTLTKKPGATGEEPDLTVSFNADYLKTPGTANKEVTVTYYAEVTEAAVSGKPGNPNKVELEYTNQPGEESNRVPAPEVKVYTFDINVVKFAEEEGAQIPLDGAKFALYKGSVEDVNKIGEEETKGGKLSFDQLDEGTYYLVETKAPTGYTLLANPIKVEIIADRDEVTGLVIDGSFTLKINGQEITDTEERGDYVSHTNQSAGDSSIAVENHKGFTLPATGGMGIVLFLAVGVAGIVAVSVLLTRKSKDAK